MTHSIKWIAVCSLLAGAAPAQEAPEDAPPPPPAAPAAADKSDKPDVAADVNNPRQGARKISFTTREGTWMSVDVSPDGKRLVFDLLGDIYELPIEGGEAKALTRGPAWDHHPRYSPDGKSIVFTSDRGGMENLWLMSADGSGARPVSPDKDSYLRSAVFTPDGNFLIVRKQDGKRAHIPPVELWMFHREGGAGFKLTNGDELHNASGPAVSPDGRYVYYAGREGRFNYIPDLKEGLWQIHRYDRLTQEAVKVTSGIGGAARPAISPDGKAMAFVTRRDEQTLLAERDLSSGAERILVRGVTRDDQEGFTAMDVWPNYAFTPDGKSIIFSSGGKLQRLDRKSLQVSEVPFVAKIEQWLAPRVVSNDRVDTGPLTARILRWPSLAPDGSAVAFDALGRVWLQPLENGKPFGTPRRLTEDSASLPAREYAPSFSADGKWIAWVSWSDAQGGHVWRARVPSGDRRARPEQLTRTGGHFANPEFSPQGDKLVVLRGSGLELRGRQPEEEELFEIVIVDAAGGEPKPVAAVKPADSSLRFHPHAYFNGDGTRVIFREPLDRKKPTDDPKNDLVSVRLDGTDKRRLLRMPAGAEAAPSRDGRWLAFTSRDNVYLTALPDIVPKDPPAVALKESGLPVFRLSDEAGSFVSWTRDSSAITWVQANVFHRLPVEAALEFARAQRRKEEAEAKKGGRAAPKDAPTPSKEDEPRVPKSETFTIKLQAPRFAPKGKLVLRGARVVTMKGDEVLPEADIVIDGNRIASVGKSQQIDGATVIDVKGKTIIPGLIDTHAHLHYSGFEIFPDTKWEYIANLAYGVTTTYDPSAPSLDVFAQAELVEAGRSLGPRIYSSGDVLYGGQQEDIYAEVNDQKDAERQVLRMKAYGARMIKVYQQPRRSQRLWFAEACRKHGMLLTAEGAGELQTDLSMALDGYTAFEHSLPQRLSSDAVSLLAKSGTYYTPTLLVSYGGPWGELYYYQTKNPHDDQRLRTFVPHLMLDRLGRRHPWIWPGEYHFPAVAEGAADVVRAGGNVSLGAHGQLQGLGVHWELWAMAGEGGRGRALSPLQALRAATLAAADKIGFAADLGSVEPGKLADLVVLDGDVLGDIHQSASVNMVVKNGQLFEAATMREKWPRDRPLPPFFWKKDD